MGSRRKSREIALQALYHSEFSSIPALEALETVKTNFEANRKAFAYARELIQGVLEHWDGVNELLESQAANWRMDRMSLIDRNIMRIAIYEICHREDVPASVAINEAIEVTKRFSTDEAGPFINGILDAIGKKGLKS